jgi:cellulose synthase/poly-beta-1,6-N-acetylglucosamine synthase-like glycosyltransferase/exo-beta-1,3-glucanase (GH17 family)
MRSVAAIVALVACVHLGVWALARGHATAPNFDNELTSVSYTPFADASDPDRDKPSAARIRADLKAISSVSRSIRLYSSTGGVEQVPDIASEFDLRVTAGAWLQGSWKDGAAKAAADAKRNDKEIREAVKLAREHSNVKALVVGNETIYRGNTILVGDEQLSDDERRLLRDSQGTDDEKRVLENVNVQRLIRIIQRVKRETSVPVTTGEIWNVWLDHPELAAAVDFIGVHILPYWEGTPNQQVVDRTMQIYDRLRQAFPGKRIVIAEFGWPSAGYNYKDSNPGRLEQAQILRDFVSRAHNYGIDYNIVEAVDQPWKTNEGGVGPYWGVFNANDQAKFNWNGPIFEADYWKLAGLAVLLGVLLSLPVLSVATATAGQAVLLTVAANVAGAWFAMVFSYWNSHYFVVGAMIALGIGLVLLLPLVAIALARVEEIAAVALGRGPRRVIAAPSLVPAVPAPEAYTPKVSIHIPAYREPPEMLKQTLDAIARLDYPNFECVVIINNTPDPALWRPVEDHCKELGERFKFVNVDNLKGFKAGALRLALVHTASDAEIIGVLDADYVVEPNWLKELVPTFVDPKVGLIQAPQDHRDGDRSVMHYAMNGEYAGFFDIGMVQRNEFNAIIVHGTMCLIRRTALEAAGSWSSDTICEDTDLGLTLLELGWQAHYTNKRYGYGLLPDNFDAYKKQRFRWAYGGFQILKKHWRRFLPGASRLTREQKREFALGWLNWLGAESVGVVVAILNIIWTPLIAYWHIAVPDKILTIPIVATFVVSMAHFVALYRLRVAIRPAQMLGAVFAAMSVQWTVARGVANGLIKDHLPFMRTDKGGGKQRRASDFKAFWEAIIAALLIGCAVYVVAMNAINIREINLFAAVLVLQSLPFLSAVALAVIERSKVNDFAYWRALEAKAVGLIGREVAVPTVPAAPTQTADKQVEIAQ